MPQIKIVENRTTHIMETPFCLNHGDTIRFTIGFDPPVLSGYVYEVDADEFPPGRHDVVRWVGEQRLVFTVIKGNLKEWRATDF